MLYMCKQAGILVGPTFMGRFSWSQYVVSYESNMIVETFGGIGLTFYMFLVGLETDLSTLGSMSKKSVSIAFSGILLPILTGAGLYQIPRYVWYENKESYELPITWGFTFWSLVLSATSFTDLARLLSDVKLLHTDIGRTALSVAATSDITVWVLLAIAITIVDKTQVVFLTLVPTIGFLLFCWFVLRPGIAWMIKQSKRRGREFGEMHMNVILTLVAVCGMVTDACGAHSMIGSFMLGIIIPNGEIAMAIMEKIEEFVTGILLPVFFMVCGLRTNLHELVVSNPNGGVMLLLIASLATLSKILSTILVSSAFGLPCSDGFAIGNFLNTKGVLAIIVLNEGRGLKILDSTTMSVMVFTVLFMTALVHPIFSLAIKGTRRAARYRHRTMQRSNAETEHRILACIHSVRNVSGIINLLELSNATKRSPFRVFPVHLVELTGHSSAMLIVHDAHRTTSTSNNTILEQPEFIPLIKYQTMNDAVFIHPLTAVSPYNTMHEDICQLAQDRQIAMILVPFHKEPNADGSLQADNVSIKEVNQNLFDTAPCSVGILIDRGLGSFVKGSTLHGKSPEFRLAVVFFGGADDQEALSYGWKMAGTPGVSLTVIRFIPGKDAVQESEINRDGDDSVSTFDGENENEYYDEDYVNEFRFRTMNCPSIIYQEKIVDSSEQVVEWMRNVYSGFDFYIVGRRRAERSPLTVGLVEWCQFQELGLVGDLLVSSDFTAHASVLVMQSVADNLRSASIKRKEKFGQKKWVSPILNPYFKASVRQQRNAV